MIIFLILGLLLGAVAVIFALQNVAMVTVTFLSWQFEGSLALVILFSLALGALISMLLSIPDSIRRSFQISSLKKHASKLEEKLGDKEVEVEVEKSKLAVNNAYIDNLEENSKV